jgi:hypothetical protein
MVLRCLVGHAAEASAQDPPADEPAIKAAFVYNFAKFTDWPPEVLRQSGKLRLCVAGPRNALAQAVAALEGKAPVRDHAVEVRTLSNPGDASACHILVLTAPDRIAREWIRAAAPAPVLTVGDAGGFAAAGGIVGLYVEDDKVRFEINVEATQRAQIKLSSQLMKLARVVRDNGAKP